MAACAKASQTGRSGPARKGLLEFEHRYSGGAVNRPSRLRWWRGASIARSTLAGSVFSAGRSDRFSGYEALRRSTGTSRAHRPIAA